MCDRITGFFRGADGETYYRSPHGLTYHYWLAEGPPGDVVEWEEVPIPAACASHRLDDSHAALVSARFDEYEEEEIPSRLRHCQPAGRVRS